MNNYIQKSVELNEFFDEDHKEESVYGVIYMITNTITRKIYIGQTRKSIEERFNCHLHWANNKKRLQYIHKSILKYGKENFIIEEIDKAYSLEDLNKKEYDAIIKYNSLVPNGYNLVNGGNYPGYSEETRQKLSIINKNKLSTYNPETNEIRYVEKGSEIPDGFRLGRPKGQKRSLETREKLRSARQNRRWIHNPETNERRLIHHNSDIPEGWLPGSNNKPNSNTVAYHNPNTNKIIRLKDCSNIPDGFVKGTGLIVIHTEETKRKISDKHIGKVKSDEHRRKLSESLRGKKFGVWYHNPETKERKRIKCGEYIPDGFILGKLENVTDELREIRRNNIIGRKWFHHPETKDEILIHPDKDMIPEGYIKGRCYKKVNNEKE